MTRNSNLYLREEESRSILDSVDSQLHRRRKGAAAWTDPFLLAEIGPLVEADVRAWLEGACKPL